jgi:hypothetical protein
MTRVADNKGDGGQWRWQTMVVVDNNGTQDYVADYDGEGWEGQQTMTVIT